MVRKTNSTKVRGLSITALLTAVIWFLAVSPIGFTVPFFGIAMTFIHIPMLIGLMAEGLAVGTTLSTMFGLTSLFNAYTRTATLFTPLFQNPLVSVLPRILIAPVAYAAMKLLEKLLPGRRKLIVGITAAVGACANTVLTLTAMNVAVYLAPDMYPIPPAVIWGAAINLPFEIVSAVLVCVSVMYALDKIYRKK